jgi:simple sugar transport system substrate-binding protein
MLTQEQRITVSLDRRKFLGASAAATAAAVAGGRAFADTQKFVPYSNKSLDYYFFVAQQESVKRAVEAQGWRFQATNASFDNTTQLQQWESILLNNPSAIISDPIDSQAIVSVIEKYNYKNIPVGIIDTPATGGKVAITVDFDNYQGGVMAAEAIANCLKKKYGSSKGTVLNCYGALQSVA